MEGNNQPMTQIEAFLLKDTRVALRMSTFDSTTVSPAFEILSGTII